MQKHLIFDEFKDLKKAVMLLHASIKKFKPYKTKKIYTPDELEYYDSLPFRFEKVVELMLVFFKSLEFYTQAKTSDTLRDRLLMMQKLKLIDDIDFWLQARLLRNRIAHTYQPEELKDLYNEIKKRSTEIIRTVDRIENYFANSMLQF